MPTLARVRLHQLGNALGIGVVGALYGHGPQVGGKAIGQTGSSQQFLGGSGVKRIVLDGLVVRPHGGWNRVGGRNAGAQVNRIHNGFLVDGHVDGFAHAHIVKRLLGGVVGQVANVQAGLLQNRDVAVLAHGVQVGGVGVGHDMALTLLQLGPADRCVRGDGEDQVVDLGFAGPVLGEGLVANDGVFLVLNHMNGPVPTGSWSIFSGVPALSMAMAYSLD